MKVNLQSFKCLPPTNIFSKFVPGQWWSLIVIQLVSILYLHSKKSYFINAIWILEPFTIRRSVHHMFGDSKIHLSLNRDVDNLPLRCSKIKLTKTAEMHFTESSQARFLLKSQKCYFVHHYEDGFVFSTIIVKKIALMLMYTTPEIPVTVMKLNKTKVETRNNP